MGRGVHKSAKITSNPQLNKEQNVKSKKSAFAKKLVFSVTP